MEIDLVMDTARSPYHLFSLEGSREDRPWMRFLLTIFWRADLCGHDGKPCLNCVLVLVLLYFKICAQFARHLPRRKRLMSSDAANFGYKLCD